MINGAAGSISDVAQTLRMLGGGQSSGRPPGVIDPNRVEGLTCGFSNRDVRSRQFLTLSYRFHLRKDLFMKKSHKVLSSLFLAGAMLAPSLGLSTQVRAEEAAADEGPKITGLFGADYTTHFISWGYDVWGAGNDFGEDATFNPYAEIGIDFDLFKVVAGTWWDVNSNTTSAIGGNLQEVDIYFGVFVPVDKFTFGIVYQDWMYAGDVEKVIDFSVAYDDSELLGAFAMAPKFTAHKLMSGGELGGGAIKDSGWAFVLSLTPGFTVYESEAFDVNLSFPINIGFGDDDFYGSSQESIAFAYVSVGVAASVPLKFIPAKYGAWTVGISLTYYHTDTATIPVAVNPDNDFLVGKVGFSVAF